MNDEINNCQNEDEQVWKKDETCSLDNDDIDVSDDEYFDEESSLEFVWGRKSWDDMTGAECCMYTMNDIELDKDTESNKYYLSIETIYIMCGETEKEQRKNALDYLMGLLNYFEKYCNDNEISTTYIPPYSFAFPVEMGGYASYEFDSIEEAFATFKMMVLGYKALIESVGE